MHLLSVLATLAAVATLISAVDYQVTSPTQDYYLLSQRQLQQDLALAELKVASVNDRGADSIVFLDYSIENLLQKVQSVEESLVPLQALSPIRKHCVQKYQGLLLIYSAVQKDLIVCRTAAQNRVNTITNTARANLNYAISHTNTNLPSQIATCNKNFPLPANQTQLETCVLEKVKYYSDQTYLYLDAVDKNLEASACTLNDLSRDALICTFKVEQNTLITIGRVLDLIDNCVNETETLCPCAASTPAPEKATQTIRDVLMGRTT